MSKLVWDASGERFYENGVDHGVFYPQKADGTYDTGIAWNGLTGFTESPDGAEPTDLWADNIKYATLRSAENFGGTLEAYMYPPEFSECDGSAVVAPGVYAGQQARKPFGFCYRTNIGSDTVEAGRYYKLHIVYNATASPSEKSYETVNDSPDAITLSWDIDTTPVNMTGYKPVSTLVIDSREVDPEKLQDLLDVLYGTDAEGSSEGTAPTLPLPDAIVDLLD